MSTINNNNHNHTKYIDIRQGWFCCKKLEVLAKYHDMMEIDKERGRVYVYGSLEDTFWGRQINLSYFEFDYCPYCGNKLYTTTTTATTTT